MVISTVNQVIYNGDGINTAWPYTFRIIEATDIKLLLIDSDGTETDVTADYYVDTVNNTVYYPGYAPGAEPPAEDQPPKVQSGQKLVVYRELPITQEKDLGEKWPFYVIELGLDKLTMILQQIYGWWDRCLKFSIGWQADHPDFNTEIPIEAGKTWQVNDAGTGFTVAASPNEALSTATNAVNIANAASSAAAGAVSTANAAKNTADGIAGTANTALNNSINAVNTANGIAGTANDALATAQGKNTYRKKIVADLPFQFPDYDEALAATGDGTYIYPQGLCFDEDENLYVIYHGNNTGDTYSIVVKYTSDFEYVGYILVHIGVESIVVKKEGANLYLYSRYGVEDALYKYDITNNAWNGEFPSSAIKVLDNVHYNFNYNNGRWMVMSAEIDYGTAVPRNTFVLYDDDFNETGRVYVSKLLVGFTGSNYSSYYDYIPKVQGAALRGDKIYISHGGDYRPGVDGAVSKPVSDIGCSVVSLDGSLQTYSLVKADKLIDKLISLGYTDTNRLEADGVTIHPSGDVYSMWIRLRLIGDAPRSHGVLIVKEFAGSDGIDLSDIASDFAPFNLQRLINGVWPKNNNSTLINPITSSTITNFSELLTLMAEIQLPRTMYYTTSVPDLVYDVTGLSIGNGALVELINYNNRGIWVRINSLSSETPGIYNYYCYLNNDVWYARSVPDVFAGDILGSNAYFNVTSTNTSSRVSINAGADCPIVAVYGKDSTLSWAGCFAATANDGTKAITLLGKPDGTLNWGNNALLTAAGGTMTGLIRFNASSGRIQKTDNTGNMLIAGSNSTSDGASLSLYGGGASNYAGYFYLIARDGTNAASLTGRPDGTLAWNANAILTAANYSSYALPLSGGTLSGNISFSQSVTDITSANTNYNGGITIYGGANGSTGAGLRAYGKNHSTEAGAFWLHASDGSNSKQLKGYPDGTLTWGGQPIQTSSDKRLKQGFSDVPASALEAWGKVEWKRFKYKADAERKGAKNCRWHIGLVAQDVQKVGEDNNADLLKYGILCHDVQDAVEEVRDEEGNVVTEARDAVDLWTIRYEEALAMEVIYLRNEIKKLREEIKALRRNSMDKEVEATTWAEEQN